jgi:hypothetical protein
MGCCLTRIHHIDVIVPKPPLKDRKERAKEKLETLLQQIESLQSLHDYDVMCDDDISDYDEMSMRLYTLANACGCMSMLRVQKALITYHTYLTKRQQNQILTLTII